MSEVEENDEVETEEFNGELSDEALDREREGSRATCSPFPSRIDPATD